MSNVKLSATELALASNADILLTKNTIINKVYTIFGHLSVAYAQEIKTCILPTDIIMPSAKISRGENYRGLPWVMLDYPRCFSGENIFSIRTMFWWGNYFSQFLFLKGKFLMPNVVDKVSQQSCKEYFLGCNTDPWQHHFEQDNMVVIRNYTSPQISNQIHHLDFLKLGTKIPIERWESVENFMTNNFKKFLEIAL